jgi:phosphate:Na+ symporter
LYAQVLPFLLGGLVLFLYSISRLSVVMKEAFSNNVKQALHRYTTNIFASLLIGTFVTVALGSSSAVIILTIILINAKALSFRNAIGIVLGANVGTTFSSQLIALDVGQYSVVLMIVGIFLDIFSRSENQGRVGSVLLYLGMLFFGLFLIEESVEPLRDSVLFREWMSGLENPFHGALIGGLVTLIIQSSSATVGLAIILGKQDLITIAGGLAVMLGAELGTCSDTLIATINGSRQAIKTGLFHFGYNLLMILLGLLLFSPFVSLVEWISSGQGIDHHIANGHMLFNILGVVIFLPFVGMMERTINRMIPEKSESRY